MVQQSFSIITACALHNCLLLLKVLNVKEKTLPSMEKMSVYYNCKHHKINVECFLFGLNSMFSLYCDIFSQDCVKINRHVREGNQVANT